MYVREMPTRPNRWKLAGREMTPAQERGKALFERATDKFGKAIAENNRCSYCHSGPKGTNQKIVGRGNAEATDNTGHVQVGAADRILR